jgi:hypothetical protein
MPKLLVDKEWYEPLQPNSVLDTAYEQMLLDRAPVLFPGFLVAQVHQRISNESGHSFAHLALIDHGYRAWWLALLETGSAPSGKYVLSQAEVLRSQRYGRDFALMLASRNQNVDSKALERLCLREMPSVFFLLAHPPAPKVADSGVRVGVAEIFESPAGIRILRINGEHPHVPAEMVGRCTRTLRIAPHLLRLVLEKNEAAPASPCEIEIDGSVSVWTVRPQGEVIWLVPQGSITLPVGAELFSLVKAATGRLQLVPAANAGGARRG